MTREHVQLVGGLEKLHDLCHNCLGCIGISVKVVTAGQGSYDFGLQHVPDALHTVGVRGPAIHGQLECSRTLNVLVHGLDLFVGKELDRRPDESRVVHKLQPTTLDHGAAPQYQFGRGQFTEVLLARKVGGRGTAAFHGLLQCGIRAPRFAVGSIPLTALHTCANVLGNVE